MIGMNEVTMSQVGPRERITTRYPSSNNELTFGHHHQLFAMLRLKNYAKHASRDTTAPTS